MTNLPKIIENKRITLLDTFLQVGVRPKRRISVLKKGRSPLADIHVSRPPCEGSIQWVQPLGFEALQSK